MKVVEGVRHSIVLPVNTVMNTVFNDFIKQHYKDYMKQMLLSFANLNENRNRDVVPIHTYLVWYRLLDFSS